LGTRLDTAKSPFLAETSRIALCTEITDIIFAFCAGKEVIPPRGVPAYEEVEPPYRYGCVARSKYGSEYPECASRETKFP
jgi:hypothetical protein